MMILPEEIPIVWVHALAAAKKRISMPTVGQTTIKTINRIILQVETQFLQPILQPILQHCLKSSA